MIKDKLFIVIGILIMFSNCNNTFFKVKKDVIRKTGYLVKFRDYGVLFFETDTINSICNIPFVKESNITLLEPASFYGKEWKNIFDRGCEIRVWQWGSKNKEYVSLKYIPVVIEFNLEIFVTLGKNKSKYLDYFCVESDCYYLYYDYDWNLINPKIKLLK